MRKPRVNVHIRPETCRMLERHVARPGTTKAGVVDTALAAYLTPENDDRRDVAIIRRLDRIGRRLEKLDRDMAVISETLSLFVRYSLSVIPPLPEAERDAAGALGRQLAKGGTLAKEVSNDLRATKDSE